MDNTNETKQYQSLSCVMTEESKLKNVKITIVKMFVNRGFIKKENEEKYINKLIEETNDDHIYTLTLDNEENYNTKISNKKVLIKAHYEKITSISKGTPMFDFINKYKNDYKFIVCNGMSNKVEQTLIESETPFEVFMFQELYINIVDHVLVPKHIVLSEKESKEFYQAYCVKKNDMPKIYASDPVAKYYRMKPNDLCKIIRTSSLTAESVFYRLVVRK